MALIVAEMIDSRSEVTSPRRLMIPPRRVVITSRDQGLLQVSQGLLQVRQGLLHVIRRLLHVLSKLVGDGRWLHHVVSEVLEVVGGQADVVRRSEADGSSSSNYAELNDTNGGGHRRPPAP